VGSFCSPISYEGTIVPLCVPVADVMARRSLRCTTRGLLNFLRYNMKKQWLSSILVRRPSHLELTARTSATNYFNRSFQALSENVFIRAHIASSAFEIFCFLNDISVLCVTYLLVMIITSHTSGTYTTSVA